MEFRILGGLEAECGGRLVPVGAGRERKVLAALLLEAGRVVPVPRLVEVIWDEAPPVTAGKQVKNAVSLLRGALGQYGARDLIVTTAGGYRLAAGGCVIDALVFQARVAAAGRAGACGRAGEAAGLLRSALGLWRGPVLAGLAGRALEQGAAVWEERRVAALEACLGLELAAGRHQEIVAELADLVAGNPFREKLAGLRMLALYRCGRQAEALAAYRRTRELLASQLGLDPGPELQRLQQQILTADPALAAANTKPVAAAPQVRHGLPADTAAFTGRDRELSQIISAVNDAAGRDELAAVAAIGGMPGAGKTTLAVHAAHALAGQFPDWQLFIDLHAHTPGREPVTAYDALAGLLAAAGVEPRCLPAGLDGRARLWRDRMAGQRALLVLDNAASSSQVTPLLPGAGGCLVLITSRRHLGDLPGTVTVIPVGVLPPAQARDMFTRLAPRAAGDRDAVAEVAGLAGFLPLAVSLLARVYARHPSWTLADLAAETRGRVLTMTAEQASIGAAFEVSYRHLDPDSQRAFRLLGIHPGPDIDAWAAAALAGLPLAGAAALLDRLHGEGLLSETTCRRYGMHDLIRCYARDLAAVGPPAGRDQALDRLLDYYEHAAGAAQALLSRRPRTGPADPAFPSAAIPGLADREQALAWARAERGNLLACLDHVTQAGQHARVVALTAATAALLHQDGPWAQAITRHDTAVHAARRLGDRLAEGNALNDLAAVRRLTAEYPGAAAAAEQALGICRGLGDRPGQGSALSSLGAVRRMTGDCPGAATALEQALSIYRGLGDQLGQGDVLRVLADTRRMTGDYPGAASALEQALRIYRGLGDQQGQADALGQLGTVRQITGDYPGAATALDQALSTARDIGEPGGEAEVLNEAGTLHRIRGDLDQASACHRQALHLARQISSPADTAAALAGLGRCALAVRHTATARHHLRQAHQILRRIGAAEASTIAAELDTLTTTGPPAHHSQE